MRHERFLPEMQMVHTDIGEDWAEAMRGAVQKPCNDFGLFWVLAFHAFPKNSDRTHTDTRTRTDAQCH